MYDERDTIETTHRTAVKALYEGRKIVPVRKGFGCSALSDCSEHGRLELHTGNWAFVGRDYGRAKVAGHFARVLFVAMDRGGYGGADEEDFPDTQASFRRSIELPRNPHMGGVALILKHLVDDRDPRVLSSQCALTNAVKCSQHTDSMNTGATGTMISRCGSHLRAEIECLDPDIVITQGGHPTDTVLRSIAALRLIREFAGPSRGRASVSGTERLVVLATPHPARQPGLKWTRGVLPQFLLDGIALARVELASRLQHRATKTSA